MAIHPECHLIAVCGGKGGVGKSLLAANLAFTLISEMRAKVLLIDLDSQSCGDQNVITGLRPLKTVMDLINHRGAVTAANLPTLLAQHKSGLFYLGAVMGPEQTLNAPADIFRQQLQTLSQHFKYIVVDIGCQITPLQAAVVDSCNALIAVTTPEILAVNQTRRLLQELMSATVPAELIQIVLNKVSPSGLNAQVISQTLKRPIIGSIPQDEPLIIGSLQRSMPFVLSQPNSAPANALKDLVRKLTGGILQNLKNMSRPQSKFQIVGAAGETAAPVEAGPLQKARPENPDPLTHLKIKIHAALIAEMDLKKDLRNTSGDPAKEKELRSKTQTVVTQLTDKYGQGLSREDRSKVIKQVIDEALGLGPLEELLADPTVTEIMVNGAHRIYVEKSGKLTLSSVTFTSNLQLKTVIERIVHPIGRRIDENSPYVDARLADGSRVNAVIEPIAIDGPSLTIRKFPTRRITMDDYVNTFGTLTKAMADFLRICVEQGLNVIISGGTGTGKTTLLNALSSFIPTNERIVTIEDAAELQLKQDHVVRLETKPPNMEGNGEITIRDLVRNSLRMRPNRIVVGECRDGAALDMLSAMNTGHDGSMTTVHSNTPREAIARLETLCLMAGMELPARAIREQIAGAVNLIIQVTRLSDGSRKITDITEVVGMQGEAVTLQPVFRFKEEGFDKNRKIIGQFLPSGLIPTFLEEFEQRGVIIPRNLFSSSSEKTPAPASGINRPRPAATAAVPQRSAAVKKVSGGDT